jgi:hypothetical protein
VSSRWKYTFSERASPTRTTSAEVAENPRGASVGSSTGKDIAPIAWSSGSRRVVPTGEDVWNHEGGSGADARSSAAAEPRRRSRERFVSR